MVQKQLDWIAAEANNISGRGIAFGAELADLQFVSPVIDNAVPATAFTWKNEKIDIYSCSFARFSDSVTTYPLESDVRQALRSGTSNGRRQRGSIYVVSSGNGGSSFVPDSCAYQGFMNNVYVILVAGIDHQLNALQTGEKCSAMMVTAPTRTLGFNVRPEMITTAGMNVTGNFGMNSAATAVVSGSIAVTLSAK
ncbi:KEX2 [Mytilus edulis]|uniref:KEX2 n=1 Tax=Mytilus edulis TaxID=6550 RepID=A0A8S3Q797_MYTED|nr:KEX2 [Mytilus edulis]